MNKIEHTGDLLDFLRNGEVDAIAHCCNCQGVMGAGIALQIKTQMPKAYLAYKTFENYSGLELGTISQSSNVKGECVYNIHAQGRYGGGDRHLNYEAIYVGLEEVRDNMISLDMHKLGVPNFMGCALAGGDWPVVSAMISSVFQYTTIDVHIVTFNR